MGADSRLEADSAQATIVWPAFELALRVREGVL
jgi:hypothetical protein